MALPQNALLNIALTTGTISVFVQVETFDWRNGKTSIQWYEITQNANNIWGKNPANPNPMVADLTATLALSNAYRALTNAQQLTQVIAFLTTYYNNLQALNNGTAQPVLT